MLSSEFVAEMVNAGFSQEDVRKALHCFDAVLDNYNITRKGANIVVYNEANINQYYFDTYIACREFQGYAKGTLAGIRLWLKKFIDSLNCSVIDATTMQVRKFLFNNHKKRNGEDVKNSSMEKIKQIISSFYNWLIEERQVAYNPAKAVQQMKQPILYQGCLKNEEVAELKHACQTLREKTIIEVCVSTGCRLAELVNIKLADINMQDRSIKVLGKGSKERIVYFSAEAKLYIQEYVEQRNIESAYLFPRHKGGNGKISTYQCRGIIERIYKRVEDRISLKHFTPHTLRRTFATLSLRRGMTLEQVSKLLGHADLQTTMRYVQIEQQELQAQHFRLII